MSRDDVKTVIQKMCIDTFGQDARVPWELDEIVDALMEGSSAHKVELELALAQGIAESHFGCNPAAVRSRKTRNIYNVGNVDNGGNRFYKSFRDGIIAYFKLMEREYCWKAEGDMVTLEMMLAHNFKRPRGGRYATAPSYTATVEKVAGRIRKLTGKGTDPETAKKGKKEQK